MRRNVASCEWRVASESAAERPRPTSSLQPPASSLRGPRRAGISLLEVLISMFVLLFGLMGVAAIFPVGNHFAGKGEQYDRGAALADQAFADLKARGMLNPYAWLYANPIAIGEGGGFNAGNPSANPPIPDLRHHVIRPTYAVMPGAFNATTSKPPQNSEIGAGHAFVLDPMGMAEAAGSAELYTFPFGMNANPWPHSNVEPRGLGGSKWPIRRITVPAADEHKPNMPPQVAETLCRLHDDLANETPKEDDRPGIFRYAADTKGTPNDPTDDIPLARDFAGNYSWLATIVPTASPSGIGPPMVYPIELIQPSRPEYGSTLYDVSVAVFHKRDLSDLETSERTITAELSIGAELIIYANTIEEVDAAVLDVGPSQWIALGGVQPSGKFLLKWYKLLSLDDETIDVDVTVKGTPTTMKGRRAMLEGPDWPSDAIFDLRAILLPGVIGVSTQSLPMERN